MATKAKTDASTSSATDTKTEETAPPKAQGAGGVYYIVNPAGAIHGVDREHAKWRLAAPGWRLATEDEIATYKGQKVQRSDKPICVPWSPDPDKQLAELE